MLNPQAKKNFIMTAAVALVVSIGMVGLYIYPFLPTILEYRGVACNKLPTAVDVQKLLVENENTIKELNLGFGPIIDTTRCPGKADIIIYYSTEKHRQEIKEKVGKNFFGVPYRMFNV